MGITMVGHVRIWSLLTHLDLLPQHRPSIHCSICRKLRPHHPKRALDSVCERCGLEFLDTCYWRRVATVRERVLREVGTGPEVQFGLPFICGACRS